jgi:mycothiol synthase
MGLPSGYFVRHPTPRDSRVVTEVVVAGDIADFGEPDFTEQDLLDDWARPRFQLDRDAWVLSGPTGRVIGYAYLWEAQPDRELEADAYIVPEYSGRGLGGHLLEMIEGRALERSREQVMELGMYCSAANASKRDLLERHGFVARGTTLRLKIDLSSRSPELARPPEGVTIRRFHLGEDDAEVHDTMAEAFEGHHRYTPRRFDEWLDLRLRHPAFDPDLWRVAEHDGRIVGAVLVYDVGGTGYLSNVGLRKEWTGRGVGPSLLRDAFLALRERGQMRVLVSIDPDTAPSTMRLYEEAGMRVHERHDWYGKTLGI